MRIIIVTAVRWAVVIVALIAPLEASAQITLSVSTDKATYLPGEPIIAHVIVTNGNEERPLPAMLTPEYGALKYLIAFATGEPREFRPWSRIDNDRMQTLGPRATRQVQARIFFGADGWTFREPGVYSVRAQLLGVISAPAQIRVQQPVTAVEQRQSELLLASDEAGFFLLFEGGDHLKTGISLLRDFAPSNTVHAGYANYALGMMSSKQFNDFAKGSKREPNWVEAESFFERSRLLIPKDAIYFNLNNQSLLADAMMRNGKTAEAIKIRQQLSSFIANDVLKGDLPAAVKGFAQTVKQ